MSQRNDEGLDLIEELIGLTTEASDGRYADLDLRSSREIVDAMTEENLQVPSVVAAAAPSIARAVDSIVDRFRRGGRLVYIGAGTPGRLGVLDASECPPTFGVDPELVVGVIAGGPAALVSAVESVEDDAATGEADLRALNLTADDAVVGISASGRTRYVLGAVRFARNTGAATIGIACNHGSALAREADIPIEVVVGPELVAGSTRLKAGTAQKLVLNTLSTASLIQLGTTMGNVMVDLATSNAKLRARAERTIIQLADVDQATAARALDESDGSVKIAIMSLIGGVKTMSARELLQRNGGRLRLAIADALDSRGTRAQ